MASKRTGNFKHLASKVSAPVIEAGEMAVQAPLKVAGEVVGDTAALMQRSGEIKTGYGVASGVFALGLAILCFLGVLAFHFPQYLTTPELRHKYDVGVIRQIMFASLLVSGVWSLCNVVLNRARSINMAAFVLVLATVVLGGSRVPVGDFPDNTPYLGLDWFILDLLGSTLIFVALEKLFPLYKGQTLFRKAWQNDLIHFGFNHLLIGFMLLVVNFAIHKVFGWMVKSDLQAMIQNLWFLPQLLLCVFVADFVEYWTHRAYHEVPFLWKFHSIHHSSEVMDWLAGSRLHFMEIIVTRVLILGALYVAGFEKNVLDAYIIIVGFQAVFNHANVHLNWGPLRYVFVTPDFHHWHHSSDDEAIDRNYAAHFSFIDYIFGTAVDSEKQFPEKYGVVGNYVPAGFLKQQAFPFKIKL
ncbi:sterol desaturase family protein [Chitinimonas sp.]|uniref:sterol desaturase family protein n=1 Tax=Chitinimonas sp. TaxID=1934313 RepID=UPI002F9280B8